MILLDKLKISILLILAISLVIFGNFKAEDAIKQMLLFDLNRNYANKFESNLLEKQERVREVMVSVKALEEEVGILQKQLDTCQKNQK